MSKTALWVTFLAVLSLITPADRPRANDSAQPHIPDKRIVSCLLQGEQVRLGRMLYLRPPRPALLPARDCEIRGGEYLAFDRSSYEASLAHWLALAKEGDTKAQIYVAEIYERGLGGREPDYKSAFTWYEKAANSGHPVAQSSLARLYDTGLGVKKDTAKAQMLYTLAMGYDADAQESAPVALEVTKPSDPSDHVRELELQVAEANDNAARLEVELNSLKSSLSRAQSRLASEQETRDRLQDQIRRLALDDEGSRSDLELELADREAVIASLETQVKRTQSQEVAYQEQVERNDALKRELAQRIREFDEVSRELRQARMALIASDERVTEHVDKIAAARSRIADLEALIENADAEDAERASSLRSQLRANKVDLELKESELVGLNQQLLRYQEQIIGLQDDLSDANKMADEYAKAKSAADVYEKETQRLSSLLSETQAQLVDMERVSAEGKVEITSLQDQLDQLRVEADGYKRKIQEMEANKPIDLEGPSIHMIEPTIATTRGVSEFTEKATVDKKDVIGKVVAPAGLLTLTVNRVPTEVNERNVFKATISLERNNNQINIVAIDRQGKRAESILQIIKEAPEPRSSIPDVKFGRFHALMVGNEAYSKFPDLKTPIADIEALGQLLSERYDFTVHYVKNGTREEIMNAMYDLHRELTSEDNLLVYYAGHGDYVSDTQRGVWLPVDASPSSPANWISNVEISDYLKQIRAKQIMVIADSCYSGALTRSARIDLRPGLTAEEYQAHLTKMAGTVARVVLTSGGLAPVLDSESPAHKHSIFASALLDVLGQNVNVLSAQDLGRTVAAKVSMAADRVGFDQEPHYAPLAYTNHQGGDFFFVPSQL